MYSVLDVPHHYTFPSAVGVAKAKAAVLLDNSADSYPSVPLSNSTEMNEIKL